MAQIDSTAWVHPKAELADDVQVGPLAVIEAGVVLGEGCIVEARATLHSGVVAGVGNTFGVGSVVGGAPQDRKYANEPTFVKIGDHNVFREFVTVHRATGEGRSTVIGSHNYLMAYCHIGHNCVLEDNITMANYTGVSGHVTIESLATVGGMVGIHQFARIGKVAMVGGWTRVVRDVPPFMLVEGIEQEVHDINAIGLRRYGVTAEARLALHKACKLIFKSQLGLTNALETVRREVLLTPEVDYLLAFEQRRFKGKNGRGDQP